MAVLYCPHFVQFLDDAGNPLSGGKLYTYAAGTTTPKATYTTAAGDISHQNPVELDSAGRATIFLSGAYKFALRTSADVPVRETDNVTAFQTGAGSTVVDNAFTVQNSSDATKQVQFNLAGITTGTTTTITVPNGNFTIAKTTDVTSGWVPIKTVTASASSSVDFVNGSGGVVLDSTYKCYAVVLSNVVAATDAVGLYFRTSTNAGSAYDSGASDYNWAATGAISSGAAATDVDIAQSEISLTDAGSGLGNDTLEDLSGIVYLFNPAGAVKTKKILYDIAYNNGAGAIIRKAGAASRIAAADIDAIRFLMSSGNITSGTFTLYGLKDA
jgi:hypothetical protein